ncbi:phosphoribosylanthranilate isomerase [Leptospira sp. 96542]|nr:phosphoribosylanthranilate isomerase [Leptospira sp. 96542]
MGSGTKIKICGIKNLETLNLCVDLSVDYVGINFSPKSIRKITWEQTKILLETRKNPNFPKVVFLFFLNDTNFIGETVNQFSPDLVQLVDGDHLVPLELKNFYLDKKILLPSFRIQNQITDETTLEPKAELVILDSFKKGEGGGTGHSFPWEYVKTIKRPYLLAGGITPDNVINAIQTLSPFGIDVASGVETDGEKDLNKIKTLVQNVRRI